MRIDDDEPATKIRGEHYTITTNDPITLATRAAANIAAQELRDEDRKLRHDDQVDAMRYAFQGFNRASRKASLSLTEAAERMRKALDE